MVVGGVRPQRARRWPVEDGESGLSLWGCAALRCDVRISDKKYVVKHHDSRVRFFQSEACFVLALLLGDIMSDVEQEEEEQEQQQEQQQRQQEQEQEQQQGAWTETVCETVFGNRL